MNYHHLISPQTQYYHLHKPYALEKGEVLQKVQLAYRTWGKLNSEGDNGILICHALTGSADADTWWKDLLGANKALDTNKYFIVCSNVLGSCYGTTGSMSINPHTGFAYGATFPEITIRDMVHLQAHLVAYLGIKSLALVIGGSLGGMQVLEWALQYPHIVRAIAPMATSGRHSAWCIGLSEAQRQAIYADPNWQGGNYTLEKAPKQGLAIARMIAMSSYRSWQSFSERFARNWDEETGQFVIAKYLKYHGQRLIERFDANTYITLTKAMDNHDITQGGNYELTLQSIKQPTMIIAISSDILYPPREQEEIANLIPNSQLVYLKSIYGHDAFLTDSIEVNKLVINFLHLL
ncbi:homoserine O-acetyltransferase [Cylindrospermopsis raciborskii S07]|uniref:homoserine O-acetyltransferase MetX n=1 Tax=Cylindrospermopsis raciborskii TaxID=77022 RepID=UPI000C9EA07C|nr:homoserine O-acetyltransferase [Cylindrospermopsis raciborskii]PNK04985.1 homoserine O-acetyltransferase [Cylindrospermopsis raciborskii S07]PNK05667.1 homoserine O-acetyltransferase [Cylindrospermopsis raciborskii S10]PNK09919.1 homoserine O-acetyltransferase [Cylindrospermopsis raciborskii S14]PNK15447.1 homoserine O-acetyltransferase [Cylindrospermopsis raciborskii S01]PNK17532.1 homoserine O-acetyltransferase [Cylindrospermopsis raciborskii S06]